MVSKGGKRNRILALSTSDSIHVMILSFQEVLLILLLLNVESDMHILNL